MGAPVLYDVAKKKKDFENNRYKWRINKNSWTITVNLLTKPPGTSKHHHIYIEDEDDACKNITIPCSEILLPTNFDEPNILFIYYHCYDFINFTKSETYTLDGRIEIGKNNFQIHRNTINSLGI